MPVVESATTPVSPSTVSAVPWRADVVAPATPETAVVAASATPWTIGVWEAAAGACGAGAGGTTVCTTSTTTGSTVLVGLDALPASINLWRCFLQWLGGMGIIVLAVAILPLLGVGGMQLYKAETTGVMKDSKLTARIADTAKALWLVYFAITAACILSLKAVGMSWLDAICHAFAALSLGGFSTYDDSVGHFDSPAIEAVLIFFMFRNSRKRKQQQEGP